MSSSARVKLCAAPSAKSFDTTATGFLLSDFGLLGFLSPFFLSDVDSSPLLFLVPNKRPDAGPEELEALGFFVVAEAGSSPRPRGKAVSISMGGYLVDKHSEI